MTSEIKIGVRIQNEKSDKSLMLSVAEEAVTDPVRRRVLGRSIDRRRGMI
jgi:hypothetical protein